MSDWMKRILESKRATRREAAELPFGDKVRIVEKLRDATEQFRTARFTNAAPAPSLRSNARG
jgi:hypothetical protein